MECSVEPRGRRHVETLVGAQPCVVVELLEVDLPGAVRPAAVEKRSGGAVRFVGDGQIERRCAVRRLSLGDPTEGVVGAEHDPGGDVTIERTRDLC